MSGFVLRTKHAGCDMVCLFELYVNGVLHLFICIIIHNTFHLFHVSELAGFGRKKNL